MVEVIPSSQLQDGSRGGRTWRGARTRLLSASPLKGFSFVESTNYLKLKGHLIIIFRLLNKRSLFPASYQYDQKGHVKWKSISGVFEQQRWNVLKK